MLTRERIVEILKDNIRATTESGPGYGMCYGAVDDESIPEAAEAILAEMDEPLAVLADRKGIGRIHINSFRDIWAIAFRAYTGDDLIWRCEAPTYVQAEQAAREYLLKLPDQNNR